MTKPRILFFGTPDFAVVCLRELVVKNYNIVGVITSPDRPAGRGKKLQASAVKQYAQTCQLPLLQPPNLKDPDFIAQLHKMKPDVAVVVAFRMLPKIVWELPPLGTFNLHASLLPQYRGAAPINWALVNGEKETGVTTFFIDDAIDTGAILLQEKVTITPGETAGSLHDRLASDGSRLIIKTLEGLITKKLEPTPQIHSSTLQKAPKLNKSNTRVDWQWPLKAIQCFVNGMNPYPTAWTEMITDESTVPLKILSIHTETATHDHPTGELVDENGQIKIAHKQGWVYIDTLQLPNKRRMTAADLLNGYTFTPNTRVE